MTKQEAYEKARSWMTRPGARRAYDDHIEQDSGVIGACRYEMEIDGEVQRCAIGCLLEREDLDRSMASFIGGVENLFHTYGVPAYLMEVGEGDNPDLDRDWFLLQMQQAHDYKHNWVNGRFDVEVLDRVARNFGLTVVS